MDDYSRYIECPEHHCHINECFDWHYPYADVGGVPSQAYQQATLEFIHKGLQEGWLAWDEEGNIVDS